MISSPNVAFNANGDPASVFGGPFDLNSGYLTAAFTPGLNVEVIGSLLGITLYDHTYVLSQSAPTHINFNYLGVDNVEFLIPPLGSGNEDFFAMDNMVINAPAGVPDSGTTAALFTISLTALGLFRRKL